MASAPAAICRIYRSNFRGHYPGKQKTFLIFLIALVKFSLNLENFQKEDESSSLIISEIIDGERCG